MIRFFRFKSGTWWSQENYGIGRRSIGLNIQRLFLKSKIAKLNDIIN